MITHETTVHGKCPINGNWDYYTLRVELSSSDFIRCEDIEEAADFVRGKMVTQEAIAKELRLMLPAFCDITLSGQHGQNCRTEIRLPGRPCGVEVAQ